MKIADRFKYYFVTIREKIVDVLSKWVVVLILWCIAVPIAKQVWKLTQILWDLW